MRQFARLFLIALAALSASGAPNPAPVNLDFESGAPGEVPAGWIAPTAHLGYAVTLSSESPKEGKQCVRVSGAPKSGEARAFGNVMQVVDAKPYRGRRLRLRGAVRVEGDAARSMLWFRVDRPERQMGFFDNMQDRPITSREWAYYEIAGDIAADAETLNFGAMLLGEGTAWADDFTLEVVPKQELRSAPPRALTPRGLENLIAFTRLFGIVRHFHASDEAAAADWDAIAVDGVDVVESAKDANELATRLADVFLPFAPALRLYATGAAPPEALAQPAGATAVMEWEHHGFGQRGAQQTMYSSERVRDALEELQPYRIDLGGGVSASIPLAVYADASRTLPRATREPIAFSKAAYSGNDRATRIGAAVVILWNVLQHFYPYFDVVETDWPAELKNALRAAATDRDETAFLVTLRKMIAAIDDGHGSVSHPSMGGGAPLPLLWRVIGDSLVITAVDPTVSDVHPGDEVIAIGGRPAMQALREEEALISGATPQWRRFMAQRRLALAPAGPVALTIRGSGGITRQVTLAPRPPRGEPLREKRPDAIAELKPGIWYVDLERATDAQFDESLDKLAAAQGIVFDMRGYPRVSPKPLQHLIDSTTLSARWNVPVVHRPDHQDFEWDTSGRWTLEPLQPRLTKNVVFLTDGRAISYAESWMGIVEAYKLGEIAGETTAGTNGDVNVVRLPAGYRVAFTGMKVLKHDGSRHQGAGIKPTVPVSPTIAGIRAGRDEQLEKAIEVVEKHVR